MSSKTRWNSASLHFSCFLLFVALPAVSYSPPFPPVPEGGWYAKAGFCFDSSFSFTPREPWLPISFIHLFILKDFFFKVISTPVMGLELRTQRSREAGSAGEPAWCPSYQFEIHCISVHPQFLFTVFAQATRRLLIYIAKAGSSLIFIQFRLCCTFLPVFSSQNSLVVLLALWTSWTASGE